MVSRGILGLFLVFSLAAFADSKPLGILDHCLSEANLNRREAFLTKLDCVYRVLGKVAGGDETLIASALINGKWIEGNQAFKSALKDLQLNELIDMAKAQCGPIQGKVIENACVNQFPVLVDRLILTKAALEVLTPSILPMNRPNTIGQLRDAHLDLLRKKNDLQ